VAQQGLPIADSLSNPGFWTPTPVYAAINATTPNDGSFVHPLTGVTQWEFATQITPLTDPGVDTGHTISFRFKYDVNFFLGFIDFVYIGIWQGDPYNGGVYITDSNIGAGSITPSNPIGLTSFADFTTYTYTLTSGEAAAITDYTDIWLQFVVNSANGSIDPVAQPTSVFRVSWVEMETPTVSVCTWWKISGFADDNSPFAGWIQEVCSIDGTTPPSDSTFEFGFFWEGIFYPPGTIFTWEVTTPPGDTGWWFSMDQIRGAALLTNRGRPKNPRSFTEIAAYATGSAGIFGGFPGVVASPEGRMIYAPGEYEVGVESPTIRLFDGVSDREVAALPNTSSGAVPIAIMTLLSANGTIYLTTLDSGSSASDWAGRVFELNIETGNLTPLGAAFTAGQLPYCLAWHNGRLWMGSNSGDPGVTGNVYFFRPGVDSAWTTDHAITDGCVTSMLSFEGLLCIGCSADTGTSAKVLVRGVDNAYSTFDTGTGTSENNCFPALSIFEDLLYSSYWDSATTSQIRRFHDSTDSTAAGWTTLYDQTDDGILKPWLAFPQDEDVLLAYAGGVGYAASLVLTDDGGSTWQDQTVFLSQDTPAATGLPAWGIAVR
jgi:hypothetical protein